MRHMPTLTDSRGKQSATLFFVMMSWGAVTIKFLVAGVNLGALGAMPEMSAGEYGSSFALILAAWLGREWQARPQERLE